MFEQAMLDVLTASSEDAFAKGLDGRGFHRDLRYSWTYRSDSTGVVSVSGDPMSRFIYVTYTATKPVEVASEVLAELKSRSSRTSFKPPGELMMEFDDKYDGGAFTSVVGIGLPRGVWKYTAVHIVRNRPIP